MPEGMCSIVCDVGPIVRNRSYSLCILNSSLMIDKCNNIGETA